MSKKSNTRKEITDLGEELIRSRGYHAFSYHDIASRLSVKNAAIHYYFPLKEDLGVEVVRTNIEKFELLLADQQFNSLDHWQRLIIFIEEIFGKYLSDGRVCLVGALSTEFPVLPESMQEEFKRMTSRIRDWLKNLLEEGKQKNYFSFDTSADTKALMIITNLIAGLQLARVMGKSDFQLIKDGILNGLRAKTE